MIPNSDSPSSSSKEPAAPSAASPAQPAPEPVIKSGKKLETPILVAMISAAVTLFTAILGNPLFINMVNKTSTPQPTAAAEFVVSQSSLLSNNPPVRELSQAAFTPTGSAMTTIEATSPPPGENSSSTPPPVEPTVRSTSLPLEYPDPPAATAPSTIQCLVADMWFLYPTTADPEVSNGCLNLSEWGFSTDQSRLLLTHTPDQDQQRGIYTPIPGDVNIHFTIQMDEFRTRKNKAAFLNFGIVQNDPFSIYTGGYLSYQQPTPGAASLVRVLISGNNQATQKISALEAGFQHDVLLSIQDDLMTVYLNGEQTGDPVKLPPTGRVFWIGYVLPSKTDLDAVITNFTIQPHEKGH